MVVRMLFPFLPAAVAIANGLAVAVTVFFNQPHNYPLRLVAVQMFIVLASLLVAPENRWIRSVGFLLTLIGIFCTFSAMFLYIPTLIVVGWRATQTKMKGVDVTLPV